MAAHQHPAHLIAVVDAQVGIRVPQEHPVNSAVACRQIGQEAIDGPLIGIAIPQKRVLSHGLRRNKHAPNPGQHVFGIHGVIEVDLLEHGLSRDREVREPSRLIRWTCWPIKVLQAHRCSASYH